MVIALSGASGFLGRHLARRLRESGSRVLPLRRGPDGSLFASEDSAPAGCDAVVHLAFPVNPAIRRAHPERTRREVAAAAASAVHLARRLGAPRVLLASSGKVYGPPTTLPVADDSPAKPNTLLGRLKLHAEEVMAREVAGTGVEALSLRIFNCYGPDQSSGFLVPKLIEGVRSGSLCLGELGHARDWIHVDDVVQAFVTALETPALGTPGRLRVLGVGTGRSVDLRGLLRILGDAGVRVPAPTIDPSLLRPDEPAEERALADGLRQAGWSPRISLERGLPSLFLSDVVPGAPDASAL